MHVMSNRICGIQNVILCFFLATLYGICTYRVHAFERAKLDLNLKDGILVQINENNYQAALDIAQYTFLKDEPVHSLSGVVWGPEIEKCWMNILRQKWSIMVIDEENNEAIGILMMKYETVDDKCHVDDIQDPGLKRVFKYNGIGDAKGNIYKHFNVKETIHMLNLCVAEKYRRRGIGTKLVKAALAMVKELKMKGGVCLKVEGSSIYSKQIFENSGFETLSEFPFDEYTEGGEQVFRNIGIHKSMKSYGMMLPN